MSSGQNALRACLALADIRGALSLRCKSGREPGLDRCEPEEQIGSRSGTPQKVPNASLERLLCANDLRMRKQAVGDHTCAVIEPKVNTTWQVIQRAESEELHEAISASLEPSLWKRGKSDERNLL